MPTKTAKVLENQFKSTGALEVQVAELKKENKALKETVTKLMTELDKQKGIDKSKIVRLELTPEQQIIEVQIMRLQQASIERVLTYDETRMLDIHIKNKRLLEDKSTINADYKALPQNLTDDELLRIAESADKKDKKEKNKPKRSKSTPSS